MVLGDTAIASFISTSADASLHCVTSAFSSFTADVFNDTIGDESLCRETTIISNCISDSLGNATNNELLCGETTNSCARDIVDSFNP